MELSLLFLAAPNPGQVVVVGYGEEVWKGRQATESEHLLSFNCMSSTSVLMSKQQHGQDGQLRKHGYVTWDLLLHADANQHIWKEL